MTFESTRPVTEAGIKIGKRSWKDHQLKSCRSAKTVESHHTRFDTILLPHNCGIAPISAQEDRIKNG